MLGFGGRLGVVAVDVTAGTRGTNRAGGGTDVEAVPEHARSAFLVAAVAGSVCGATLGLARVPACGWAKVGWCGGDAAAGQAGPRGWRADGPKGRSRARLLRQLGQGKGDGGLGGIK